jgi:serine protease Do
MAVKRSLILLGALSLVAPALARSQSPQRGWVGVAYTTSIGQTDQNGMMIFPDYPVIESIEPGSPAEKAGLQAGDKIIAINSQDLKKEPLPLGNMLQPGRRIVFRFRRNDDLREISLTVAPRPAGTAEKIRLTIIGPDLRSPRPTPGTLPAGAMPVNDIMRPLNLITGFDPTALGIAGAQLMRLDGNYRELSGVQNGVFVVNVAPGSPAMQAGLQSTDVIIKAGQVWIDNPGEIAQLMNGVNAIRLQVIRKKKPHVVTLRW